MIFLICLFYSDRISILFLAAPLNANQRTSAPTRPDFPGCVAAADTEAETIALMKEALALHIEDMRERGETVPPPSAAREIEVAA